MMSLVGADTRSRHHLGMGRREPTHGMVSSSRYVVDPAAYRRVLPVDNSEYPRRLLQFGATIGSGHTKFPKPSLARASPPRNASDKRRGPETT
jgi:hypothetical protein